MGAQEEKLEKQKEQDLSAVDSKFALLKEEITIVNKNILEVDAKVDSIGNNMKTLQDNVIARLDSQNQTDIEIRQDFESFKNSHNKSVDDIENLNTEQAEKIRALEEASMHHGESQQTINILNTRVNQLDELRQQSESKAKDEADASLARSTTIINEFKTDIENNVLKNEVDNLKDDLSGLKNISVDIKNTQSEHNQSTLKELADLLEKIDNETAKLNELKHHVSDLDDSVTALSPDINKNADKIQELDAFKLKLEPLSTSLTQDIASLRGDGKLAEDKLKDLKDYSQKLQDAITAIQENEKHTEKDLAGVKDDSETLAEKLEDLQDKLIVFESKLTGLENANQTNMADLINIKEQNFV